MGTIFNDDFREFIQAMNNHDVEYILVGGYAVILHGYRRKWSALSSGRTVITSAVMMVLTGVSLDERPCSTIFRA